MSPVSPVSSKRNTVISICKAIAIILMVIGHAESPDVLHRFLYEFHMPLFFAAAGYFFSLRYLNDETTFIKKRLKGLYLPFVKWSIIFLILHNWMFDIGILNEVYGNESGGVTHPYAWRQTEQCLWNIVTAMGGYDQFLNGAFWFFRGLLVASILYLIIYKGVDWLLGKLKFIKPSSAMSPIDPTGNKNPTGTTSPTTNPIGPTPYIVCGVLLLLCAWKTYEGLKIITLIQGGYRELMGCFFFGCGFIFRQWEHKYRVKWWTTLLFAIIVWWFSQYLWANMNWRSTFEQFLSLPLPAMLGCLMVYNISTWIDKKEGIVRRFLIYCGDHTLSIFVFHILCFKLVSLLKIWYYGLDPRQIGCHMVIHEHSREDWFWVLYTIVGVGLPLLWMWGYEWLKKRWRRTSSASPRC